MIFRYYMGFGKLRELEELVKGFVDTHTMVKAAFGQEKGNKAQDIFERSYTKVSLEIDILKEMMEAEPDADLPRLTQMMENSLHDARYDVWKMPYVYQTIVRSEGFK